MHSYINHSNVAWASTSQTKLKKNTYQQKHVTQIIFHGEKKTHGRPLLKEVNA